MLSSADPMLEANRAPDPPAVAIKRPKPGVLARSVRSAHAEEAKMGKRLGPGAQAKQWRARPLCVHCVKAEGTTDDHGIPVSWYPDGSAENVPRVKAPACSDCNGRLKRIEEEVLLPLIFAISPDEPRAAGIADRIRRSMDPSLATDERDRRARTAKRERFDNTLFRPQSERGAFPGAEAHDGTLGPAAPIRAEAIKRIGEKLTRVVLYDRYRQYVATDRRVETHIVSRGPEEQRVADLIRGGERIEVPPGIFVAIRRAADDPATVLGVVDLWGQYRIFTSILPPAIADEATGAADG